MVLAWPAAFGGFVLDMGFHPAHSGIEETKNTEKPMGEEWRGLPATEEQKEKLQFLGATWQGEISQGQASAALERMGASVS